jgi:phytoene desaturase
MTPLRKVVVAGGGVGGLSAAIHACLAGYEVVLIEQSRVGGKAARIQMSGFSLDPGPSIVILPEIYRDVFRAAGKNPDEYIEFLKLDPITRVFVEGGDGWTDIPASFDRCLLVANQISQNDSQSLARLFDLLDKVAPHIWKSVFKRPIHSPLQLLSPDLIAVGKRFAQEKSFKDFVDKNFESDFFKAFFYGFPSYSGQSYTTRSMSGLLIPYFMFRSGVFYPVGGVSASPEAFERLARELGVVFKIGSAVSKFWVEGRTVQGVELCSGEFEPCDYLISNIDRLTTQQMMGKKIDASPSFSYFTVHWGINRRLPNLSHHVLLVPKNFHAGFKSLYVEKRFPDPAIVYLNATSELDPNVAPRGCTNLFAVVSSPACEPGLDWEVQAQVGRRALKETLQRFGWDFEADEIVFERIQTPTYFQSVHGNFKGSLYGPQESERLFGGLFPLRCKDETYRNLFYAGGSVQPGAGLPMVTLSGKFAVDLITG